jgi:hypothetical protein
MKLPRLAIVGVTLLVIGILPALYAAYRFYSHNWTPLAVPIALTAGNVQTPDFVVDNTGTYVVKMAFDPLRVGRLECLVGDQLFKNDCDTVGSGLDLGWAVRQGNQTIIDIGTFRPQGFGRGAGEVTEDLGQFEGTRGERYKISLRIRHASAELNDSHPRLKIEAHRVYWERWIIFFQVGIWFAIPFCVAGLICCLVAAIRAKRHKMEDPTTDETVPMSS